VTDAALAAHTETARAVQVAAFACLDSVAAEEREAAQAVYRQAVALRRALEQWIVMRALQAPR